MSPIKFKDKKPEDYKRVLFFDTSCNMWEVGYFVPSQSAIAAKYSHWIELPKNPNN